MKMKFRSMVAAVMLIGLLGGAVQSALALPIDGEEKCSPSGTILRYREYRNGWVDLGGYCRQDPMRDMVQRNESTGRPIDGEERCNPNGEIVRYREYNRRWNRTGSMCDRSLR